MGRGRLWAIYGCAYEISGDNHLEMRGLRIRMRDVG
jgi:hypothetical protein